MGISRRRFVTGVAGLGLSRAVAPDVARAADGPIRIGLLTVKTGPLASGGIDMERALTMFLNDRGGMMSGRKVELMTSDTSGVPATARTMAQEMVEKNNVHCLIGPLAAFEALAIEIWPTSIVVPKGYRIALSVRGKDYQWQAATGAKLSNFKNELLGCGPFLHDDPRDRPRRLFAGTTTLHIDRNGSSRVLVPIVPGR